MWWIMAALAAAVAVVVYACIICGGEYDRACESPHSRRAEVDEIHLQAEADMLREAMEEEYW